jgi:hypothetical protein
LQFLPALAVSAGLMVSAVAEIAVPKGAFDEKRSAPSLQGWPDTKLVLRSAWVAMLVAVSLSYFFVWKAQPLCFTEAWVNSRTKLALESSVARTISQFPRDSRYLTYVGDHVGAFQQAGVPLLQVINEGNHRPWKRPADPEGLWERTLAEPAKYVDYVIAYDGDAVDQAVKKNGLTLVSVLHTTGQARAWIYATRVTP